MGIVILIWVVGVEISTKVFEPKFWPEYTETLPRTADRACDEASMKGLVGAVAVLQGHSADPYQTYFSNVKRDCKVKESDDGR